MAIIGADSSSYTPSDVERKRKFAAMLLQGQQKAKEPFGALAQGLRGALSGWNEYEAGQAEGKGRSAVAELLQSGDYKGALGNEWASPQQSAMASMLQGREWEVGDRNQAWAREDARAAAAASRPEFKMFEAGGDQYRYNANDPNSRPELFFDGPDQASGFRPMSAEEKAAAGLPPDIPAQIGPDGKIDVIGGSGVNVDVNNMGNIPAGYKVDYDAQGNPVSMSPVPGSPAAAEAAAAADKALLADENQAQGANIVVEDVGRAIDLIKKDPTFTTGVFGKMLSGVGGTNANSVGELVKTVKANSAFDQLQSMRAASPTGGALGAVSDTEMGLLQSAIGSLEQSQNSDQLVHNLKRVQGIYNEIVNGPGAALPQSNWTDLGGGIRIREK